MPCDTIQTMSVQSELKNVNWKLLKKALEALGFTVNEKQGALTFYGVSPETGTYHAGGYGNGKFIEQVKGLAKPLDINVVKRAYSKQIVQQAANAFGWKLTATSKNTYIAQKR